MSRDLTKLTDSKLSQASQAAWGHYMDFVAEERRRHDITRYGDTIPLPGDLSDYTLTATITATFNFPAKDTKDAESLLDDGLLIAHSHGRVDVDQIEIDEIEQEAA